MKRLPINNNIKKIKTLFKWIKCDKCGYEFRREYIWEVILLKRKVDDVIIHFIKYVCLNCCTTLEDVENYRLNKVGDRPQTPTKHPQGNDK